MPAFQVYRTCIRKVIYTFTYIFAHRRKSKSILVVFNKIKNLLQQSSVCAVILLAYNSLQRKEKRGLDK